MIDPVSERKNEVAVRVASRVDVSDRQALVRWTERLLELKGSNLPALQKAKEAISATANSAIVVATAKIIAREMKRLTWDDRGLPARLGMGAAATGAALFGGQAAGLAALGTAIGVPLWVVFGAGGAFMGVLYEELTGKKHKAKASYRVIDAERDDAR